MMRDRREYRKQVRAAITNMANISPDTNGSYRQISGAAGKTGKTGTRMPGRAR